MPRQVVPLTETRCRTVKPVPGKVLKLFDGGGLFLEVRPGRAKHWRLKYRFDGKEKLLALGTYPELTLAEAREARSKIKRQLAAHVDPAHQRRVERERRLIATGHTFEAIAREWHTKFSQGWAATHACKVLLRLENNVFPWIGPMPIGDIEVSDLLAIMRRMEKRGALDTARRVRQYISSVYRYAIATARAKHDLAADVKGATPAPLRNSYPSITDPARIGGLLRAIDAYEGSFVTRVAVALAPRLFCRPGELRGMRWQELNLDGGEWRIPPARQKLRQTAKRSNKTGDHIVPLATQVVALLKELQPLTGTGEFVFPSERSRSRSMSDGTVNAALRRMGYSKDQIVGHGFRHMASTLLNEQGWSSDAIERQLSHGDGDPIRGIYNQAKYLPERRRMMQAWADYLDVLAATR